MGHHGALVILTDTFGDHFIVQRKDNKHPKPECCRTLSWWGGAIEGDETPLEAAIRELDEEISIALPVERLRSLGEIVVPAVQWAGDYTAHVFVLNLRDGEFMELALGLPFAAIREGLGERIDGYTLTKLAHSDTRLFVASHGDVFLRYREQLGMPR